MSISKFELTNIFLYPNPSNKFIYLHSDISPDIIFHYKIIDISGKIVKSNFSKFNTVINIEDLINGKYIIQIETEKGNLLSKKRNNFV